MKKEEETTERQSKNYLLQMNINMFISKGSREKRIKHTSIAVFIPWSVAVGVEAR